MTTSATGAKPHLSYSALDDFLRCGKQFELRRVLGIEGQPGFALAGGSAVHAATEAYDRMRESGLSTS